MTEPTEHVPSEGSPPARKASNRTTDHLPADEAPPAWNAAPPPTTGPAASTSESATAAAPPPPSPPPPPAVPPVGPPVAPPPRSRWRSRNVPLLGVLAVALVACILGAGITAVAAVAVAAFGHGDRGHPNVVYDRGNRGGDAGTNPFNGGPGRHHGLPMPGATPTTSTPSPSAS